MTKQRIIASIIATALVAAGVFAFIYMANSDQAEETSQRSSSETMSDEPISDQEDATSTPADGTDTANNTEGRYVDYETSAFENDSNERWLFFHAEWCPQCRALENSINSGTVPAGVTIYKVDYDNADELRRTYDIRIQTTVVKVDENGDLVESFAAYEDPSLDAVTEQLQ